MLKAHEQIAMCKWTIIAIRECDANNVLSDFGIATAAEFGLYGPEGKWLIEGPGVDPDIVTDNPPQATFRAAMRNWRRP